MQETTRATGGMAAIASLSLGAAMVGGFALAQSPSPAMSIPEVAIEAGTANAPLRAPTGNPRQPGTVRDVPQTITVVPQQVLREQNATTLDQALRNVPGITSTIGEGNGGVSGDQFRIRGFSAQNDVLMDGLRDFGSYQRDAFTYEDVQVLKGAGGLAIGTSAIGGGINVNSRMPSLTNRAAFAMTGGMGPYGRFTADVNRVISDTAAMRLNLMGQHSSLVGRDGQDTRRWGIAPSVAFGIGTPTTFSLEYLHYEDRRIVDSGMPIVFSGPGAIGRPASEYGVRRGNWYGIQNDRDDVTVDRLTARFQHRLDNGITFNNDARLMRVDRTTALTAVSCPGGTTAAAYASSCSGQFFRGLNPVLTYGGGSNAPFQQINRAIQNVTSVTARFNTGPFRHELVAGLDVAHEVVERRAFPYASARPSVRLLSGFTNNDLILNTGPANNLRETVSTNLGLFVNERLWLLPTLSVFGGVHWTHFDLDYRAGTPGAAPTTNINIRESYLDPRMGVIFEPTPAQTYYYSYSTSTTPPGTFFTTFPASAANFNAGFQPERNTTHEIGARFELFNGRLGLSGALFQSEKGNALVQDAADPTSLIQTGDRQRVRGVELGVAGRITPAWSVQAAYSYMDSETTRSTTPANVGRRVQYVPTHAASLWTTYDIAPGERWNLTLGGGVTWRDQVFLTADNTAEVPANFTFDAMVQHRVHENLTVRVNGYNLTDRRNYDALFGNRATVAAGRTVLVTVAAEF